MHTFQGSCRATAFLSGIFAICGCLADEPKEPKGAEVHVERVGFAGLRTDEIPEQERLFRSADEWHAFWDTYSTAPTPEIDFETKQVAAVFWGPQANPGYRIRIDQAKLDASGVVHLVVDRAYPDPSRIYSALEVYPCDMVTFDAKYQSVVWSEESSEGDKP